MYFDQQIIVRYSRNGFPDDTDAHGPTIVSTASLQAVCDWFPGVALEESRRRFRTTLEVDGVPAFWEDRLFGPKNTYAVRFRVGEVDFEGSNPCARCSVPPRDSYTGADGEGFQKRFSDLRREHLPPWATAEHFDHFYLALQAAVDGLGVALGPLPVIDDEIEAGRLVMPLIGPAVPARAYCLVVPLARTGDPTVQAFCDFLKKQGAGPPS